MKENEIEIIRVALTEDAIEASIHKDKVMVMEVLANFAMMQFGEEHNSDILSLLVGTVMRALACDTTGRLQEKTLRFMELQIPILRAQLQLQHERLVQEEDDDE